MDWHSIPALVCKGVAHLHPNTPRASAHPFHLPTIRKPVPQVLVTLDKLTPKPLRLSSQQPCC